MQICSSITGSIYNQPFSASLLQEIIALGGVALYSPYQIPGQATDKALMEANISGTPTDLYKFSPVYPSQYDDGTGYETTESALYPAIAPVYIPKLYNLLSTSYTAAQTTQANQPLLINEPVDYGSIENTGALTIGKNYEIVTTETDHFYSGSAVGDVFYATTETALDANNTVKEVLTWGKPHVSFSGSQSYSIAHTQALSDIFTQGSFSILARIKFTDLSKYNGILSKSTGATAASVSVEFFALDIGRFSFYISNGTTTNLIVSATNRLVENQYTTIGVFYDKDRMKAQLYQDGAFLSTETTMTVTPQEIATPLKIGTNVENATRLLTGDKKFILLCNQALSLSEFQNISSGLEESTS